MSNQSSVSRVKSLKLASEAAIFLILFVGAVFTEVTLVNSLILFTVQFLHKKSLFSYTLLITALIAALIKFSDFAYFTALGLFLIATTVIIGKMAKLLLHKEFNAFFTFTAFTVLASMVGYGISSKQFPTESFQWSVFVLGSGFSLLAVSLPAGFVSANKISNLGNKFFE